MIKPIKEFEHKNIYEYTQELQGFLSLCDKKGLDKKTLGYEIYRNNGRHHPTAEILVDIQKSKTSIDLVDILEIWSE